MGAPNTNASALPKWADGHPFWPQKKKNCFAAGQNLGLQKRPPKTDPKRKSCFVSSAQYQCFGAPKMSRWAPFLASEKKNCFAAGQNLGLQKRPPKTDPKRKNCFVSSAQYQCFGAPKMGRWAPFLASGKKKLFRSRP